MKIITVLGARPQFIKAGTVSRELAKHDNITEVIVHTGQHYDANMSDVFFKEMEIPEPKYSLGIGGTGHGAMTGRMLEKLEEIMLAESPDWVLVYGDTNSTLAGALAASKLHLPVAHIEAGLRSYNRKMPEEINRVLTDHISQILFCPSEESKANLAKEGITCSNRKVVVSGDVMQDGAIFYRSRAVKPGIRTSGAFVLCTIHRAENTDDDSRLEQIIKGLNQVSSVRPVVLPLHPRTRKKLLSLPIELSSSIEIIEPVGYHNMMWLLSECSLVLTDSGGLQKEAFFFDKPCITLRDETEWTELISLGVNRLVSADAEEIYRKSVEWLDRDVSSFNFEQGIYGGGQAASVIAGSLLEAAGNPGGKS